MKIVSIAKSAFYSTGTSRSSLNNADMCTIAKSNVLFNDLDRLNLYVAEQCQGVSSVMTGATELGGTGVAEVEINPGFYPYATAGSECAAVVTSLDWANNNLGEDYEFISNASTGTASAFLVSGTLTSSKTDFNDPFEVGSDNPGFVQGVCWASQHVIGNNPF